MQPEIYCSHDEAVDPVSLKPHPRNPNTHPDGQIELLAKIIRDQGWRAPITVSKRSGFIIKGHGRLQAGLKLGCELVPVDYQDYATEADEWADMIADNRIAELAEIDSEPLKDLLQELDDGAFDMDLTGFDEAALEDLLAPLIGPDDIEEDEVPEVQDDVITETGRIYQLGPHRLMCGDSTNEEAVSRLMDGEKADMCVTDPPYNVAYEGKTKDALTIQNDSMGDESFYNFLLQAHLRMAESVKKGGALYVFHADSEGINFRMAYKDSGFLLKQCCIWVKQSMVMGRQDFHWQHEPVLYGWLDGASHEWHTDRKQTTLWEFDRPSRNAEHPTMKPVELIAYPITCSSRVGSKVLDLFGGSGTTLIACEQTKRKCYMMELDPKYCDVIVRRYAKLVGADADEIFEKGYHKAD